MILSAGRANTGVSYADALRLLFFPRPADCTKDKVPGIPVPAEWWREDTMRHYKR
jgi:hypothetical protein